MHLKLGTEVVMLAYKPTVINRHEVHIAQAYA